MNKSKVIRSFRGIWYDLYFLALFFFSLRWSIGKRSTLAKIWGRSCSPRSPLQSLELPMQESVFNGVADLKACNLGKRLQHRCLPVKFAKFLRTCPAAASEFCSGGCVKIVSVSNIRCISNQCMKVKV